MNKDRLDLDIRIYLGFSEEALALGERDEFSVTGAPHLVQAFLVWWHESGTAAIATQALACGSTYSLVDVPNTFGVCGTGKKYLTWRDAMAELEQADTRELVAA